MIKIDIEKILRYFFKSEYISLLNDIVEERYSENHRHFHTLEHVYDIINNISTSKIPEKNRYLLYLAAIYHDIIYKPLSSSNELDSAKLFKLHWLKYSKEDKTEYAMKFIYYLIIQTKHHKTSNSWYDIFNKYDMSIVYSKDKAKLIKWEEQIYNEYHIVGKEIYKEERLKFLKTYIHENPMLSILIEYVQDNY